ncbi:hypothetical protein A2533_02805 [Candidatus Falkowbacteria bacterium RIFOXYD2_FULL_35_9]|nr:MAG: hypothetical protein A2223_01220 [Candidatus Falkowbacteria bacterium RIFOXYA2_FULL_35_8]OGF47832.1 MAG: hypothetical protein A2533_02805 [Candidatus Falkowbacteria bacterium RIFOXYD2_FULL_35_9]
MKKGITLLEVILIVAAIAILAGIITLALNPSKQLSETRNAQRAIDVKMILDAVYQYDTDNNDFNFQNIPQSTDCLGMRTSEICKDGGSCDGLVDLSVITAGGKYLTSIPNDPMIASYNGTGYNIVKSINGRITVCAPGAEYNNTISITK